MLLVRNCTAAQFSSPWAAWAEGTSCYSSAKGSCWVPQHYTHLQQRSSLLAAKSRLTATH